MSNPEVDPIAIILPLPKWSFSVSISTFVIKDDKYFYKIFAEKENCSYKIINNFNKAVKCNFFNDITLVKKYIKYNGKYIGYVYPICDMNNGLKIKRTNKRIDILFKQPDEFKVLYRKLCNKVYDTGIAYTDLYYTNIVKYDNILYLIDLESVVYLKDIMPEVFDKKYTTLPVYYMKFVKRLLYKKNYLKIDFTK